MRLLIFALALFPAAAMAESFSLASDVTAATLYPSGASLVREVPFEIPAGRHELVLTDLPASTPLESLRVELEGATLGAVTLRQEFVPPRDPEASAEIEEARGEVERLEGALRDGEADVAAIRLEAEAADARMAYLTALGAAAEGKSAEELRAIAQMIGEETLAAQRARHDAEARAGGADRALNDLRTDLERARKALAALQTEDEETVMLSVAASSNAAAQGIMRITYVVDDAGWMPTYDMRLDKTSGRLEIARGALVAQYTGENWENVELTLSTVRPSEQLEPREVYAWQRRVIDPPKPMPRASVQLEADSFAKGRMEEPLGEPMIVVEEAAMGVPSYDGLAVSYAYPEPVSVANEADGLRIALGQMETEAEVRAFAAPLYDDTGFMMASITNDMDELILPSAAVSLYVDGRFVGASRLGEVIPVGAEADLAFGAIDGLRLKRSVTRNEGDRGMISRSTELSEDVKIEVENLTGETWPVVVFDRAPYSEQEELEINWSANPRPSETDYKDRRGVLVWEFDLGVGATQDIKLSYELEWPEGKVLR